MEKDRHYLMRMNQSIGHIEKLISKGRGALMESMVVQHAVLWNLELISLAARQLTDEVREEHPQVDWDHMCKLSREVIGNPWEVDNDKLWQCIEQDLPTLRHHVKEILIASHTK